MEMGDEGAHKETRRTKDDEGRVHFVHPRNEVYLLLVASSTVLVLLSVAAISVWFVQGRRDEAYRWMALYSMSVLCLVASLWIFRLIRLLVHLLRLFVSPASPVWGINESIGFHFYLSFVLRNCAPNSFPIPPPPTPFLLLLLFRRRRGLPLPLSSPLGLSSFSDVAVERAHASAGLPTRRAHRRSYSDRLSAYPPAFFFLAHSRSPDYSKS
ncbi:hypothetical protein BHE74_00055361 [Ensete ventricosum]|nr:hypothetical protein BHE74_00055361 [Ensete ventricosum]